MKIIMVNAFHWFPIFFPSPSTEFRGIGSRYLPPVPAADVGSVDLQPRRFVSHLGGKRCQMESMCRTWFHNMHIGGSVGGFFSVFERGNDTLVR